MKPVIFACALTLSGCAQIPPATVPGASSTQARAVVLDIDGTLTPHDLAVFEARPGAAEAVNLFEHHGYAVVYVTTRVPAFQAMLPGWLEKHGFPPGTLHVAQTAAERAQPADYKASILAKYQQAGWTLAYAYGDSSTDFEAYTRAGISSEHIYALKRQGQIGCQPGRYQACLAGWNEHLPYLANVLSSTSANAMSNKVNLETGPAAALPPRYLFIPQFKDCLETQTIGSYQTWCMPQEKPQSCPTNSWEQLRALEGRDRMPLCNPNTSTP